MRNKSLFVLSIITIIVIVAAVISSQNRAPQTRIEQAALLPQLKDRVNDITAIVIDSETSSLLISKHEDKWLIQEGNNFPAGFDKLRKLVIDATELTIISGKTTNPALFAELGVEDPVQEGSLSHLLTFRDSTGNTIESVIVGNRSQTGSAGLYVRKPGSNETFLATGTLDVSTDVAKWIDKNLLDIANDRIMETTIIHPDGTTIALVREQGQENFTLLNIPDDKQPKSAYFINQPATFLYALTIDNLKSTDEVAFPETTITTTIKTYDGLIASIRSAQIDWINHVTISFGADEEILAGHDESDSVRQEISDLNNKVENRVFVIPVSKYYLLDKKPEDLWENKQDQG